MQPLVFKGADNGKAISPRSPLALAGAGLGMDGERKLPGLSGTPLRDRVPSVVKTPFTTMKVAFFTGDSLNYFYPDTGMDLIEVLSANNIEVHIPKAQNCCGVPVLVHGDVETVRNALAEGETPRSSWVATWWPRSLLR